MEQNNNSLNNKQAVQKPSKAAVFIVLAIFITLIYFLIKFVFGDSSTIGKYTKEDLPENFEYRILKDESSPNIEKNQLDVEISQKLTEGQIATLAEELYNSKSKQRRFYIFYNLKNNANSIVAWAISHFDPELEIEINGSSITEDNKMLLEAKKVNGKITGVFDEQDYTFSIYTLYEDIGKTFIKTSFKSGESMTEEMIKTTLPNGIKLIGIDGGSQGEYFILNGSNLDFYNSENKKFTTAIKIE